MRFQFQIGTLVKVVAASALALWLWRSYGAVGLGAAGVVVVMVLFPVAAARVGGRFGEPVLAGTLGGAIGWGLLALAVFAFVPSRRLNALAFEVFVPTGAFIGFLNGLAVFFRKRASKKPRPPLNRRRVIALNLVLGLVLVGVLSAGPWIGPVAAQFRVWFAAKRPGPARMPAVQPNKPVALP